MIATIIILFASAIGLGISLAEHGKPKSGKYNFWEALFVFVIEIVLYYYAGLFDNFK